MTKPVHPGERDRVVLVTGAAGGLGRALVESFQSAGWRVYAGCRAHATAEWPPGVARIDLDVTDGDASIAAAARIEAEAGRIDCLVNNAGVAVDGLVGRLDHADWERTMAGNLDGTFRTIRAFLPLFLRHRDGHIVNISSHAAHGAAGQAAYAAAKAALIGMSQSLAREMGGRNLRVNAVLPGVMPTGMTAELPAERLAAFAAANALRRLNDPAEAARFVVHLASMRNVSGQVFHLDSRPTRWA